MKEPVAIHLPDGRILTKNSSEEDLNELRRNVNMRRWFSHRDPIAGTDAANLVAYSWLSEKAGKPVDWDDSGTGEPLEVKTAALERCEISSDIPVIAIFDASTYTSFVSSWPTDDDMLRHLHDQTKSKSILVCDLGYQGCWDIAIRKQPVTLHGVREAIGHIAATEARLILCDYSHLLTAAQFDDLQLPNHEQGRRFEISIAPGDYKCRFIQMYYRPRTDERNPDDPGLYIELLPSSGIATHSEGIFWNTHLGTDL